MPIRVKIDINEDGSITTDLDGFKGVECDVFMDDLNARLKKNHGLIVESDERKRKAAYGLRAGAGQNNQLRQGGQ